MTITDLSYLYTHDIIQVTYFIHPTGFTHAHLLIQ